MAGVPIRATLIGHEAIPVIADYQGTGRADFAVYTSDNNGTIMMDEYVYQTGQTGSGVTVDFANSTDIPLNAPTYFLAKKVRGH